MSRRTQESTGQTRATQTRGGKTQLFSPGGVSPRPRRAAFPGACLSRRRAGDTAVPSPRGWRWRESAVGAFLTNSRAEPSTRADAHAVCETPRQNGRRNRNFRPGWTHARQTANTQVPSALRPEERRTWRSPEAEAGFCSRVDVSFNDRTVLQETETTRETITCLRFCNSV